MELVKDLNGELTARPEEAGALLAALSAIRDERRNVVSISINRNGDNSPIATINANCAHCPMTATIERLTATIERLTAKGGPADGAGRTGDFICEACDADEWAAAGAARRIDGEQEHDRPNANDDSDGGEVRCHYDHRRAQGR